MTTGGGDAALREEARLVIQALDEALAAIDADARSRLLKRERPTAAHVYEFIIHLYQHTKDAKDLVDRLCKNHAFASFINQAAQKYQTELSRRVRRLQAADFSTQQPTLFRLLQECLPKSLALALVAAVNDGRNDVWIDLQHDLYDDVSELRVVFGSFFWEMLPRVGETHDTNAPKEIVARIANLSSGDFKVDIANGVSGMRPLSLAPIEIRGAGVKSEHTNFRFTRGLPIAATDSKREGMPTDDEASERLNTIKARLHVAGVQDENERSDVYASLARRKLLYRRHKIFPLAPNERIDGLTDAALAVAGGLRGGATRLLDADQGRAKALLACLAERCDDFPSVDVDSDDQKVEIWRTVLPFYDFHDLYEFVDHRGGEVRRSFFLYGHDHEHPYPALIEPWRLEPLDGRSHPLHLMNSCVGVDTRTTDLAAEHIRFFCSHLIGNDIESGSFTVVEEMDDIRFLADRRKPIDELYAKELALMQSLVAPLLVRQTTERPLRGNAGDELSIDEPTSKGHLAALVESPVNISGAILTYDRRLFYSEVAVPAVRIEPQAPTFLTKGVPFQILMFSDFPLIAAPLPIRVIRYAGFGAAAYTLSANAVRAREGG